MKELFDWKKIFEYDVKGKTQKLEMRYAIKSVSNSLRLII